LSDVSSCVVNREVEFLKRVRSPLLVSVWRSSRSSVCKDPLKKWYHNTLVPLLGGRCQGWRHQFFYKNIVNQIVIISSLKLLSIACGISANQKSGIVRQKILVSIYLGGVLAWNSWAIPYNKIFVNTKDLTKVLILLRLSHCWLFPCCLFFWNCAYLHLHVSRM
jgi:hypothetical protein